MKNSISYVDNTQSDDELRLESLPRIKGVPQKNKKIKPIYNQQKLRDFARIDEQLDILKEYNFTYAASRHEEWWLLDSLGPFYEEQWFDDVIRLVQGGKEANVYLCEKNSSGCKDLLAAKVYRPRSLRNLRKDHIYREGRAILDADGLSIIDERQERAIKNRTTYGQSLMHTSWIEHEFKTLKLLHQAGCDVPRPLSSDHNAILMEYVGDEFVGAPELHRIRLNSSENKHLFGQIIHNIELMLGNNRVHGDLSAYNILYWDGEITLIDFPQAINADNNPNAFPIFQRDVQRICEYFHTQGVKSNHNELSEDLWIKNGFSIIPQHLLVDQYDE